MARYGMSGGAVLLVAATVASSGGTQVPADGTATAWPSFRGVRASGTAEGHPLPVSWNVPEGTHVQWTTSLPGLGHSSPVIWGDRIFVTTAVGPGDQPLKVGLYGDIAPVEEASPYSFRLLCLDRRTGKLLWERVAHEGVPKIKRHTKASHANSTPATDGRHVAAFFGAEGLYVYDFEGKLLWKKDLGLLDSGYYQVPEAQWGFGSSPIIHDGRVVVQCDVQGADFLAAFDVKDGREIWRTAREEVPGWGTPTIVEDGKTTQIVVNGYKQIAGYAFSTGERLWQMRGGGDIPVPTPIAARDLVFITNAHGGSSPVWAIRPAARGDITLAEGSSSSEKIAWSTNSGGAYMQTPLLLDDVLYVCRDNGVLTAMESGTGKTIYVQRLGGGSSGFTASAVAGDGKLYFTSEVGDVYVVRAGRTFELLAENSLGEIAMATPAISSGVLYFRTRTGIVAIGSAPDRPQSGS